jgi:hypothetical protein
MYEKFKRWGAYIKPYGRSELKNRSLRMKTGEMTTLDGTLKVRPLPPPRFKLSLPMSSTAPTLGLRYTILGSWVAVAIIIISITCDLHAWYAYTLTLTVPSTHRIVNPRQRSYHGAHTTEGGAARALSRAIPLPCCVDIAQTGPATCCWPLNHLF